MRYILLLLGVFVYSVLWMPHSAHADISYTISPLIMDIEAAPRDIIERSITITNTSEQTVTIYPSVHVISTDEGGGIQEFVTPSMTDRTQTITSWTEISRLGFDLKIGESRTLPVTFRIHPNPVPGVYHEFIGFSYGLHGADAEARVLRGEASGVIVNLTIPDRKSRILKLSRFMIDRFITNTKNQAATYTIKNPGEEPLVPTGEIIVYDGRGTEVAALSVNEARETIPPGEERVFNASVPTDGLLGKYKAFLSVEYGPQRATVHDTAFFYVLPLKTILPLLGGGLFVIAVIAFLFHRRYVGDDENDDGAEQLFVHVREGLSEEKHHDINLKQQ